MKQTKVSDRAYVDDRTRNGREPSGEETQPKELSLWDRILRLVEEELAERRSRRVFVRVLDGSLSYEKEISELSQEELRGLDPELHAQVAEQLLERYLADEGYVDLLEKRCVYSKRVEDLSPQDLPAVIEAECYSAKEHREEHERKRFVREVHEDFRRLPFTEVAGAL